MAYEDIIHKKRPVHVNDDFAVKHSRMRTEDRAKIFTPFAALKGYEESIQERQRVTELPRELDEEQKALLSEQLDALSKRLADWKKARKDPNSPVSSLSPILVTVVCFERDESMEAIMRDGVRGKYVRRSGALSNIDQVGGTMTVAGASIAFNNFISVEFSP